MKKESILFCLINVIFIWASLVFSNLLSAQNILQSDTIETKINDENVGQINEVFLNSKQKVFESDKDKIIFNVQNSALTAGQTVLDLVKKLPGVTVGQNDEILFRGAAGINVMIDGKMTYLSGNQLGNYLKGMSAEDLNKIELITTPSSEFDAAGNAGIINIITKTKLKKGYALDIRSSLSKGKFWMTNQNISASLRTKEVSLYGSFDFNMPYVSMSNESGNTIVDNGNIVHLKREYENDFKAKYYTWRFGADWQFLQKHNLALSYHGYLDDWSGNKYSTVKKMNTSGNLVSYSNTENILVEPYHYDAVNVNYKFDIDSLGKKITADANYTLYRNFSDGLMTTQNYSSINNFINEEILKVNQPGFVKIFSVKADADLPFKKFQIKTGLKYAEVSNDNEYRFDSLQAGNYVEIEMMSNHFKYKERIVAAYLSGSKKFDKTNVEVGLRLEHTNADGYTLKQNINNNWQYTKLFPSLAVEQTIDDDNKIALTLSRRINRPSYTELNPIRWYNDPYFYYSGNPNLVPELAWAYLLTYSLKNKYIFSASYNQSINYIARRLEIEENAIVKSMSDNFGKRHRFDLTVSVPFKLFSFWDVQLFSDLNYTSYPITLLFGEKRLSQWATMTSLQQSLSLPKGFKINLAAYFYTPEMRGIYQTHSVGWIDLGVKKTFFNKKLDTQFSITDVLNTNRYWADSKTNVTDYYYRDKPYSRVFGFSLTYHFGSELIKNSNKKTEEQERL